MPTTELADIHDIVEHLRKHTLGGEHDEEQVVDALVRVMDRRPELRKLLKPADVAYLRAKKGGKGRYAFDEVDELEDIEPVEVVAQEPPIDRAAHYARDWNDLRAAGRNVTRDEITAAASDLAGTGVYVAWNASDDAPGWEAVPGSVVDAVMGRYSRDGEPGGGVMFGGEIHTGDDEQERIHLIADILHGVYGDDVMSMFEEPGRYTREPDGRYAKWGAKEAAQHPRGADGKFVKRGTGEAATATRERIKDALKGGKGTAKELAGHLDLLTVKQLAEIKKEYQISASGRNKAELVAKLAERLSKGRGDGEAPEGESPSYAEWGAKERESRKEKPAEPEAVGEKPAEGEKGKPAAKEPHEMTADEFERSKQGDTYGDWYFTPDGKYIQMRGSGGMGSNRVGGLDINGKFVGYFNRDELRLANKQPRSTASTDAADAWAGDVVERVAKLRKDNEKLLLDMMLTEQFQSSLAKGKITQEQYDQAKKKGNILSDADIAKAKEVRGQIEEAKNTPLVVPENKQHRAAVESALASGKPVPDAVLADYPDLAAKYGQGKKENNPSTPVDKPSQSSTIVDSGDKKPQGEGGKMEIARNPEESHLSFVDRVMQQPDGLGDFLPLAQALNGLTRDEVEEAEKITGADPSKRDRYYPTTHIFRAAKQKWEDANVMRGHEERVTSAKQMLADAATTNNPIKHMNQWDDLISRKTSAKQVENLAKDLGIDVPGLRKLMATALEPAKSRIAKEKAKRNVQLLVAKPKDFGMTKRDLPKEIPADAGVYRLEAKQNMKTGKFAGQKKGDVISQNGESHVVIAASKPYELRDHELGGLGYFQHVLTRPATEQEVSQHVSAKEKESEIAKLKRRLLPYDDYNLGGYQTESQRAEAAEALRKLGAE